MTRKQGKRYTGLNVAIAEDAAGRVVSATVERAEATLRGMRARAACVVRLDDARYGAGPATVLHVGDFETAIAYRKGTEDRDGCTDDTLRVWAAHDHAAVGDRVSLKEEPTR